MAFPWMAVATVAGSLYSAKQSKKEAQRNREFQADMSSSAYQRAMADMRKAGLNPILAGKLGPASTPAGAMAKIPDIGQSFAQGMSTAFQGEKLSSEISKLDAVSDAEVIPLKGGAFVNIKLNHSGYSAGTCPHLRGGPQTSHKA